MQLVSQKESLELAVTAYQEQLGQSAQAQEYLMARGIGPEVAHIHRLGYVGVPEIGHEQYTGRLAIPYVTPSGVVDVRFRAINQTDSPKYLSQPGSEGHMFNVRAFQVDSEFIAITEGEIDAIVANDLVGIPAIGVAGANAWKSWYSRAFNDYIRVIILCDGDQPGRDWGRKIANDMDNTVIINMPDGMDVNDVYLLEGADGVLRRAGL